MKVDLRGACLGFFDKFKVVYEFKSTKYVRIELKYLPEIVFQSVVSFQLRFIGGFHAAMCRGNNNDKRCHHHTQSVSIELGLILFSDSL